MNVYLDLIFGTTDAKLFTLRVPNAADSDNPSPVKNSMNKLIDANCIDTKRGDLSKRERARLVRSTVHDYDLS